LSSLRGIDFSHFKIAEEEEEDVQVPSGAPELKGTPESTPALSSTPSADSSEAKKTPTADSASTSTGKPTSSSALTQQEHRATGQVKSQVYLSYFRAWGPHLVFPILVFVLFLFAQLAKLGNDTWLAVWTESAQHEKSAIKFYLVSLAL
jgi:hypothetical protein